MAVSAIDGTASLHQGHSSEVSSLAPNAPGNTVPVRITSIDTFTRQHPQMDVCLVKIDAEGHDLAVLHGMERLVARDQPLILCECDFSAKSRGLCAQWRYEIFAFTCDRSTLKMNLQHFTTPAAERLWYKMLFLVPPHLAPEFIKLAARSQPAVSPKTHPAGSAGAFPSAPLPPASSPPIPPRIIHHRSIKLVPRLQPHPRSRHVAHHNIHPRRRRPKSTEGVALNWLSASSCATRFHSASAIFTSSAVAVTTAAWIFSISG